MWSAVFPGQGSQSVGMGKFLHDEFSQARLTFEEASDTLNVNFRKLCFDGPEAELALTHNTQPALLLVSTAMNLVLKDTVGFKPSVAAGHSLGEYSALVASGSLSLAQALKAVRFRGEAMQRAVPVGEGAMVAVLGLSDNDVTKLCQWVETTSQITPLEPANFNAPGQVVVSGRADAVDWMRTHFAPEKLELLGKPRFIPLNVSAPFHCSMMKPAQDEMTPLLDQLSFQTSVFPIVQNFNALPTQDSETQREGLRKQITAPVLWTQSVMKMKSMGVSHVIEVGPGKVLSGLLKKIDSSGLKTFNIQNLEDLKQVENMRLKDL